MKLSNRRRPVLPTRSAFAGFQFPPDVIVVAVRRYLRYNLSYRDVEELLIERGVEVDHVTVFRWVQRFTPLLADAARFCRHAPGDRHGTPRARSARDRRRRAGGPPPGLELAVYDQRRVHPLIGSPRLVMFTLPLNPVVHWELTE